MANSTDACVTFIESLPVSSTPGPRLYSITPYAETQRSVATSDISTGSAYPGGWYISAGRIWSIGYCLIVGRTILFTDTRWWKRHTDLDFPCQPPARRRPPGVNRTGRAVNLLCPGASVALKSPGVRAARRASTVTARQQHVYSCSVHATRGMAVDVICQRVKTLGLYDRRTFVLSPVVATCAVVCHLRQRDQWVMTGL